MTVRALALIQCCVLLAACGSAEPRWATDAVLKQHNYRPTSPPEIRLYTVVSTRSGSGAHSGLLITTPQERILFDPAGTFTVPFAPERNDVHFAMSPRALAVYIDYHARETYDVVEQRLGISALASAAIRSACKAEMPRRCSTTS